MSDHSKLLHLITTLPKHLANPTPASTNTLTATLQLCATELALQLRLLHLDHFAQAIHQIFAIYHSLLQHYNLPKYLHNKPQKQQVEVVGIQGQFGGSQINLKRSTSNYDLEPEQEHLLRQVLAQASKFNIVVQLNKHERRIKILHSKSTDTSEDALQIFSTYKELDLEGKLLGLQAENEEAAKHLDYALEARVFHESRGYSGADQLMQQIGSVLNKKADSVDKFFKFFHYVREEPQEDVSAFFEHIQSCFRGAVDDSFEITLRVFKEYLRRRNQMPQSKQAIQDLEAELKKEQKKLAEEFKLRQELTKKMVELDMKKTEMQRLTSQLQELQSVQANSDIEVQFLSRMKQKLEQDKEKLQINIHSIQKNITTSKSRYQHDQSVQCNIDALDELRLQIKLQDQKIVQLLKEKKKEKLKATNTNTNTNTTKSPLKKMGTRDVKDRSLRQEEREEEKEEQQDVINVSFSHSIQTSKSNHPKPKQALYRQNSVKIEDKFIRPKVKQPYSTTQLQLASIIGSTSLIKSDQIEHRIKTQLDSTHIKMKLDEDSERRMRTEENQSESLNTSQRQVLINKTSIHYPNRKGSDAKSQGNVPQRGEVSSFKRMNEQKQLSIRINNDEKQYYFAKPNKTNNSQQTDLSEMMLNKSVQTDLVMIEEKTLFRPPGSQKKMQRLPLKVSSDQRYLVSQQMDEGSLSSELSSNYKFLIRSGQSPQRETGEWNISDNDTKSIRSNQIRSGNDSRMKNVTPNSETGWERKLERTIDEEMQFLISMEKKEEKSKKRNREENEQRDQHEKEEMDRAKSEEVRKQKKSQPFIKKLYENLIRRENRVTRQIEIIIKRFLGMQSQQQLNFQQFQLFYSAVVQKHESDCGDVCIHLVRFMQRLGGSEQQRFQSRRELRAAKSILLPFSRVKTK